ncbi:SDR family oxidoreductase [Bacillus sp. CRN 9]|nr:SDR family oxidoreductase [Bacillus sp. CRN 9]
MRLENKTAIITGGGGGIGRAAALKFSIEGAKVMVADYNESAGIETVNIIKAKGGNATFLLTDVTKPSDVESLVAKTVNTFGRLDILLNNAGIAHPENKLVNVEENEWRQVVDVCLNGVYHGLKYAIPVMTETGGSIINTASVAGIKGQKLLSAYSAAKSGVVSVTQTAAAEYGKYNIRVNAIAPGIIDTSMAGEWKRSHKWEALSTANALRRIGTPDEVANALLFLASDESSFITGTTLVVDGGTLIGR